MSNENSKHFEQALSALRASLEPQLDTNCAKYWDCILACYNSGGQLGCMDACAVKYPGCTNLAVQKKIEALVSAFSD